jgi:hypothetical protein
MLGPGFATQVSRRPLGGESPDTGDRCVGRVLTRWPIHPSAYQPALLHSALRGRDRPHEGAALAAVESLASWLLLDPAAEGRDSPSRGPEPQPGPEARPGQRLAESRARASARPRGKTRSSAQEEWDKRGFLASSQRRPAQGELGLGGRARAGRASPSRAWRSHRRPVPTLHERDGTSVLSWPHVRRHRVTFACPNAWREPAPATLPAPFRAARPRVSLCRG